MLMAQTTVIVVASLRQVRGIGLRLCSSLIMPSSTSRQYPRSVSARAGLGFRLAMTVRCEAEAEAKGLLKHG